MQKIRHATNKHRTVLIVIVALLAVGLVGSFAVWGAADNPAANNVEDMSTTEKIDLYESYIAQNLPAAGEEITYDKAGSLAGLYMNLRSLYYNAYSETTNEDAALGKEYYDKSVDAATKAAEYYQLQIDNASEDVTDYVKAGIMGNKATALAFIGEKDAAQTTFDEALALAANNYELAVNYLSFVYTNDGLEAAQAYAASYMELVGEESSFYAQMQAQIDYIEQIDEIYQALEDAQNQSQSEDGANTDENADDGAADDNEGDAPADDSAN